MSIYIILCVHVHVGVFCATRRESCSSWSGSIPVHAVPIPILLQYAVHSSGAIFSFRYTYYIQCTWNGASTSYSCNVYLAWQYIVHMVHISYWPARLLGYNVQMSFVIFLQGGMFGGLTSVQFKTTCSSQSTHFHCRPVQPMTQDSVGRVWSVCGIPEIHCNHKCKTSVTQYMYMYICSP